MHNLSVTIDLIIDLGWDTIWNLLVCWLINRAKEARMEIGSEKWKRLIIDGAGHFGVHINRDQAQQLALHAALMLKWNRTTNLTAITDSMEVAVKHFLDSIITGPLISPGTAVLDIGSGAGFPGIPLKIVIPSLQVTLIDASRKKISFLKHAIRTLNLENIEARHIRAEDFAKKPAAANCFDVITSRALSSIKDFVLMAAPLLAKDGAIIALKGPDLQQEIEDLQLQTDAHTGLLRIGDVQYSLKVETFTLPYLESQRSIIILKKVYF